MRFLSRSETDTQRLGTALAKALPRQITIALYGTLGAGKTRLVQALAAGCGVDPRQVVSPTYTLCHEYHGPRDLFHLDWYRIADADELDGLGLDEYFASPAITLIEWADRFPDHLPSERLEVQIDVVDATSRQFEIRGTTPATEAIADQLLVDVRELPTSATD